MEFAEPLTSGDYPQSMRSLVGSRLPKFTKEQSKLLIGSFDFLGLNYYTGYYASDAPQNNSVYASYTTDYELIFHLSVMGSPSVQRVLRNGVDELNDPKLSLAEALNDTHRIDYYNRHLHYVQSSIE
ncbi:hypothetical protein Pyn_21460 [Prunus yedoensis var. nudiflora]|uniref:Uncharacterized protein n=1 Tax=Prunus yedoensis var. nudiflora TaxID=2094558 RepID=A0A314V147_PRUYE|nr:hypothetical protein Pyn_21460 [Prunus yedoensis var. nudiflora]